VGGRIELVEVEASHFAMHQPAALAQIGPVLAQRLGVRTRGNRADE